MLVAASDALLLLVALAVAALALALHATMDEPPHACAALVGHLLPAPCNALCGT